MYAGPDTSKAARTPVNRYRRELNQDELKPFKELATHTCVMGAAFLVVFAVAAGLELFARYLVTSGCIDPASYIGISMTLAARALVTIDVVTLIGVVAKKAARIIRRS